MALETTRFDIQDHLKSRDEQVAYLEAALDEGDPSFIAVALGDIARARGVTKLAQEAGISRETIYKTFRQGGNPTLETISAVTKALGLKLALVAA
ncbi:putative addiction module antidote protein [Bosea caraganae]|uniref:Putative addiction module antidote protein n=1 Tax=Bosea caraganae TaxID=2763117 RepID=A0A370L023_9HYPH|nr:addiction module antidote protein [Bosea caraganae]RDJ20604.1 putative addiction module antidote protein [Bosea caraganae]RDJ28453.1 putative addiction module antidote protein [Bosea caraganae]